MNRRNFLKQVCATAAVGVVAPKLLAQDHCVNMGIDTAMAGASRVAVGGGVYAITLDIKDWTWKWLPMTQTMATSLRTAIQAGEASYTYNDDHWCQIVGELTVDNKDDLGEDKDVMNRANYGHSFTPAAQPLTQNGGSV